MNALGRYVGGTRHLAVVAVIGLLVTTAATFGLAIAKTTKVVSRLLSGGWADESIVVAVLEAVDSYLLAVVQLIVALGLHGLFVGDAELPGWLRANSLQDLKNPIVDVLIVFVAIQAIERYLEAGTALDALMYVAAGAVLILSLTAFRVLVGSKSGRSG